ncbi:hypothetical protein BCY86_03295 [Pajaroellobacter abortibovis]|uniref:GYF domain-containing protein n=2 Tax=Pajaroellobacter abortibovis TaxID=1882918 RepID=A0A1L6MW82_9BACT|nr:hypothetical protein BCY86_03295 [Pajaroellobacter abortibovis]
MVVKEPRAGDRTTVFPTKKPNFEPTSPSLPKRGQPPRAAQVNTTSVRNPVAPLVGSRIAPPTVRIPKKQTSVRSPFFSAPHPTPRPPHQSPSHPVAPSSSSKLKQWYTVIKGASVGPLTLSELQTKAALSLVHADSLVWREGQEQWLPLHSIQELSPLLAKLQRRANPSLQQEATSRFSSPKSQSIRNVSAQQPAVPISTSPPPFSVQETSPPSSLIPIRKKGMAFSSWLGIALVVFAGAFGVTATQFLFSQKETKGNAPISTPPSFSSPPVAPKASTHPLSSPSSNLLDQIPPPPLVSSPTKTRVKEESHPVHTRNTKEKQGRAPPSPSTSSDLFKGSGSLGVTASNSSGPLTHQFSGPLTTDQLNEIVAAHKLSIRRNCWERLGSDLPSAKIVIKVVIGPRGQVQQTTATGDNSVVAQCITKSVRSWKFPASGETTTVDIPFSFARQ